MELFCPHCGWRGIESQAKVEEIRFCKKHNVIFENVDDGKGGKVPFCHIGRHLVNDKDLAINKKLRCPDCGADDLIEVDWEPKDRYETMGVIADQGRGMMLKRTVLEFLDDRFSWFGRKGKKDLTMLPILPPDSPLTKEMQLMKGEKFKIIFERIKKGD